MTHTEYRWKAFWPSLLALALLTEAWAKPNCNTRAGFIAGQPAVPETTLSPEEVAALDPDLAPQISSRGYDDQTLILKLEADIDNLITFDGRYTSGVPVLGLRIENYPDFDPQKHCNRVFVQLVKPRIEKIEGTEL